MTGAGLNAKLLIDAIVRQTTVLIAQLATSAGMRAPLAHLANQTFLSLVGELERQGIGQKVIADMFGLALRSYQQKVQRLSESATDRDMSLWEAIHRFLHDRQVVSRAEVLRRFARDDQATVRGVLSDMVDTGLVYKTGRGDRTVYRVASAEDMAKLDQGAPRSALASLVWVTVYREGPVTRERLGALLAAAPAALDEALADLLADGRVREAVDREPIEYTSERCFLALGEGAGWEAALLDHYQAMVQAMCAKLAGGGSERARQATGGSTYSFDVWAGHPLEDRVYGLLKTQREATSRLWDEVQAHNGAHPDRVEGADRVTFYFGQWVAAADGGEAHGHEEGEEEG